MLCSGMIGEVVVGFIMVFSEVSLAIGFDTTSMRVFYRATVPYSLVFHEGII
jgi:hypothetical protein